jgi:predicted ATP-grasp superfamily ATP-dependent carboligase
MTAKEEPLTSQVFSGRILIVAFEGWNDAAEAASGAAKYIAELTGVESVAAVEPEDYYDFQFARPSVFFDPEGNRQLSWPTTEMLAPTAISRNEHPEFANISVMLGVEPSRRWRTFTEEILEMVVDREIDTVIFLGAMLAEVPHTRPIGVHTTSQNDEVREQLGVERSRYEGQVGILTVLGQAFEANNIATLALWASVPHYVHNSPSPKAMLSIVAELEKFLGVSFDRTALAEQAFTWERGIDEISLADEDMAAYITELEKKHDEAESPQASGDFLANEFEKFLRQNENENENDDDSAK